MVLRFDIGSVRQVSAIKRKCLRLMQGDFMPVPRGYLGPDVLVLLPAFGGAVM